MNSQSITNSATHKKLQRKSYPVLCRTRLPNNLWP